MKSRKLKIVITAGPTREKIDPVRYITNESSGKMGYEIAAAAAAKGAEVILVSGPTHLTCPEHVRKIDVVSADEMFHAVMSEVKNADIFIGVAAVADFSPIEVKAEKIKKNPDSDVMVLKLKKNPDILAEVAKLELPPFTVGFAAETHDLEKYAKDKLARKKLNMICANLVSESKGFNKDKNEIIIFDKDGSKLHLAEKDKNSLAIDIVNIVFQKYQRQNLDCISTSTPTLFAKKILFGTAASVASLLVIKNKFC